MFTRKFYKLFEFCTKLVIFSNIMSFRFCSKTKKCIFSPSAYKKELILCIAFTWVSIIAYVKTLEIYMYKGGSDNPFFNFCFTFSFISIMELFVLWMIYFHQYNIVEMMNHVITYLNYFQGKFLNFFKKTIKKP